MSLCLRPNLLSFPRYVDADGVVPLHQPFSIAPNNDFLPDFDDKVRKLNDQVEKWTEYWDNYQKARGVPEGDLLREGRKFHLLSPINAVTSGADPVVITAAAGTILYTNARILHGIRRRRDVTELSEERRSFLIKAVRAAENIVNMCLRSQTVCLLLPYPSCLVPCLLSQERRKSCESTELTTGSIAKTLDRATSSHTFRRLLPRGS